MSTRTTCSRSILASRRPATSSWPIATPSGRVNIFHINADQTLVAEQILGDSLFKGRFNIGYWAWELEKFPETWLRAIDIVDELWAPSRFIQSSLSQVTDKRVVYMPLRVELPSAANFSPYKFGMSEPCWTFLFFFDFNSFSQRKNPEGVIQSFRKAFPISEGENVRLVIKTIGGDQHSLALSKLMAEVCVDPRIVILNETFKSDEMAGLVAWADCFVSLHRSEGFGRGMAEAMASGRPVIATGYGGNTDFMRPDNSFLVEYSLIPVADGAYVEATGAHWADPDLDHAARLMRLTFEQQDEAKRRGQMGKTYIDTNHSRLTVTKHLRERLSQLATEGLIPKLTK